ncbi:filamentous hemagglutinin family protein [Methylobacillus caricis]|uniref:filamentous haemagglutinin family protein n=1 Tax=Methylobacillus caricis TaxID=1971611 RepID=UPI001CFF961F|nr:filamentous haemagglutinin family protein [Methylobacillus caricis]MCB5188723.1 filamentous hemagglutinin family protein [Methylobacillus caricis]
MNQGLFRLVFNKRLGIYVPAHEMANATSSSGMSARVRRRAIAALIASLATGHAIADVVPLPSSGLVPGGGAWSNAYVSVATPTITTIQQSAPQAIANWQQFNLARDHTLNINQQANWQMLHRIHDLNPSIIAGTINAPGTNYFVNTNGIIFANGAQVNVGSLMALTSADMTDALFTNGLLSNLSQSPVFSNTGGFVKVEAGAALNAASGGRIMLLAKDVENHGVINTPDGQTILAAGEKVYLKSSTDPAGLLVEVDSGGTATNLGEIIADRGNVTLVGLAVNQQGRISASTSVRANGSVHLLARDSINAIPDGNGGYTYQPSRYGTVTIGKNSVTEVRVETADKEEVLASQTLAPSRINIEGRSVDVNGLLSAKGGEVNIAAKSGEESIQGVTTPVRVLLNDNARIDVSGVDTTAAMEKNQLKVQLYSDQLKDTPILRGGALFGETVYLDARKGTDLFDVSPLLALRTQTIAEKMSKGGTINITSMGDVVTKAGSVMDISGGVIDYAAGYIRESKLIYQGRAVAISQADRNTPYEGLADVYKFTDPKWGWTKRIDLNPNGRGTWQQAYREGRDAGTININSNNPALLNGNMQANTRSDVTQRTNLPDGGKFNLTIGAGPVRIQASAPQVPADFTVNDANPSTETILGTSLLQSGFNHLGVNSQGSIDVDTAIVTAPNGSVNLKGGGVNIHRDIVTPGGDITVATQLANQSVVVDDGVRLSSAGNWNNDSPGLSGAMQMPIALDGGSINLGASENLLLGQGSVLDASAGAWLDSSGVLHTGNGGDITLSAQNVSMGGRVQSYGFTHGGKLSVSTAQNIQVGGQPANVGDLWLRESFFEQGGFVSYAINNSSNGGEFVVGDASGESTLIHPKMQTLMMSSGYSGKASGTSMAEVAKAVLLPEGQRGPSSVSFSAVGDGTSLANLTVLRNTIIRTDAPDITGRVGSIALEASHQLTLMGSLLAPAGDISLKLSGDVDQVPYDNQQSIWIGDQSVISVTGSYVRPVATAPTLASAKVLDGGSITIDAQKGFVVAAEGSLMDVSGTSGAVDVNTGRGMQRQILDGGAGTISISARDGMILNGDFRAGANGTGEAGTLKIALTGDLKGTTQSPSHPTGERVLTVTSDKQVVGNGLQARDSLAAFEGKAQISTEQMNAGRFDHVSLESTTQGRDPNATQRDRIVLQSGVTLAAPETMALTSSSFEVSGNGVAQVNASHVTLATPEVNNTVQTGDATLKVNADWIDLNGTINLSGIKQAELNSRLDIRGRGLTFDNAGSLKTNGSLLMTARQIYPVSNSSFNIEALGNDSSIIIRSSGEAYKPVFSAGGKLGLKAKSIQQEGVLLAPLGQISLDAPDGSLIFGANSLTSTSAAGLSIPYGTTMQGGTSWNLPNNIGQTPAEKRISYNAKDIDLKSGAVIDISGSGDTFAYEWIQGIGGSTDILSQQGVYAILPSIKGEYAPFDYDYTKDNAPGIGQAVYLSGIPGLAAGYYTLLPARYALLEGAYIVQANSGQNIRQGTSTQLHDGSSLVSGYLTNVNSSSRNATWDTFRVTSGSVFRTPAGTVTRAPSEYMITSGNVFFAEKAANAGLAVPRLAGDAGQLILSATDTLTLNATLKTDKAKDGRGAMVDIVSDKISVVSELGADDGSLQIKAASLTDMNAESILLGGSRTQGDQAVEINTISKEVKFSNDANQALKVNQLIATASDRVTVVDGAVIEAESAPGQSSTSLRVNGDGALLAVSGSSDIVFDRTGASSNPTAGTLDIQNGSQIQAARSLVLDATRESTLDGKVRVDDGGSVTLGANSILLGNPDAAVSGMRVDNNLVASLGNLKQVTLNSHGNLNLYGEVDFGSKTLDVTINAAGIVGHDMAVGDTSSLAANHLVMKNSAGAILTPAASNTGSTLAIDANSISVEGKNAAASSNAANAGNFALGGFDQVQLTSSSDISFSGTGTLDINATDTRITSGRITAATGTNYTLNAQGALTTLANNSAAQAATAGLGAKLSMVAQQMNLGGNIDLASGQLTVRATQGDLNVTDDARINTSSRAIRFDRFTRYTPGGVVSLQSDQADINVASGASIDVSGGEGGNAGTLKMSATAGDVNIAAGTLHGQAAQGQTSGSFVLDSATLAGFSGLNDALNSGGFNASRELRIRNGDVTIAAGDTVKASHFVLSADGGAIDIAGTVDASGNNGGDIQIYAKSDLTLKAGGQLLAKGEASDGKGGNVLLASESGNVKAEVFEADGVTRRQDAALIDVAGSKRGDVVLRAERVGTSGLKVDADAPAAVAGADKILLESVKVMNVATTLNATTLNDIRTDTNAFYADSGNTAAAYKASSDGVTAIVAPHTELRTNGNTTLATDWNLRDLSLGRDGALTIRSTGNLQLNGSISDGFANATATAALSSGDSWSINLVSGADMAAVNHLSTIKSDTSGNMVLANNKLVRTGTGDINMATGGNLTLSNTGSVIYTAGNAAAELNGFVAPTSTDGFGTNGAQYLTNGGNLNIATQGDITGALAAASGTQQIVNNWLFRQGGGSGSKDTTWWLRTDLFQQGVASFGGGDVAVKAGGNITNFSVSVPTTARFTRDGSGNSDVSGGGNLNVAADGDIRNGMYFAGKGHMDLQAGEIGRTLNAQGNPITFGTTLALQDATASVTATGGVYLETVFNPTLFAQSTTNAGPTGVANSTGRSAFFNSYADYAAVDVASLTGTITFGLDQLSNITGKLTGLATVNNTQNSLAFYPGSVQATAFGGDIYTGNMKLMPSATGELSLLAAGSIVADQIVMSDAERSLIPSVSSPMQNPQVILENIIMNSHSAIPLHRNSNNPVSIVARDGSLTPWRTQTVSLTLPKASVVAAGLDILNLDANLQNMDNSDLSVVRAGRDISYANVQAGGINVSGPGNLLVEAGRNLDLGRSNGINSLANTVNAGLPAQGASVTVLAGVGEGANLDDYINLYIKPDGSGPSALSESADGMAEYRAATAQALAKYMREVTGDQELSEAEALTRYLALEKDQQAIFAYRHFSSELLASGKGYATTQSHARGDAAIATLWQQDNYKGDMSLFQSRIRTVRDGSIDLLAPGGMINVGVAGGSSSGNIGIVTEGGGDIRAFADTGFQVNQSRVITQYGSDITVWVNNGDIDAGRGSKTALSIPEVEISTDVYGNTTRKVKGAAAGSGIQAQTYDADGPGGPLQAPTLGSVALMAPRGVLNASEAGIVAGDFLAVATQVLGTSNINVAGTSTGVAAADTGSLAAANVGTTGTASSATSAATDMSRLAPPQDFSPRNLLPSFVSVEVLGLGDIMR